MTSAAAGSHKRKRDSRLLLTLILMYPDLLFQSFLSQIESIRDRGSSQPPHLSFPHRNMLPSPFCLLVFHLSFSSSFFLNQGTAICSVPLFIPHLFCLFIFLPFCLFVFFFTVFCLYPRNRNMVRSLTLLSCCLFLFFCLLLSFCLFLSFFPWHRNIARSPFYPRLPRANKDNWALPYFFNAAAVWRHNHL